MNTEIHHFLASDIFQSSKTCNKFEKDQSAVYIFSSVENEILYIGASRNINKRLKVHRTNLDKFDNRVHVVTILSGFSEGKLFKIEESILAHIKPQYNKEPIKHYIRVPEF
jgi:excinuclease UvrABC nuclease subunit